MRAKKINQLLMFVIIFSTNTILAQLNKKVGGIIYDENRKPLISATITEFEEKNSVTTTDQGLFSITLKKKSKLTISSIGFKTIIVDVSNKDYLEIQLESQTNELKDVVVTALGVSKQKKQLGYSVSEIKGSDVSKSNEANIINAFQGKIAGVQIDQGGGGAFGTSKIVIRGNSTLGTNNQPIFVIDGIIMDNDVFGGTGRDFGNDLKNLNPEDFESISVLKGSAAAALYGSKAINGVILISSKKGKKRKGIGVSFTQTLSITEAFKGPDFQNEFGGGSVGDFFTDAREPNYLPTQRWETKVFPIDPISKLPYIDRQIGRELENWGPRMLGQQVINYDGTLTQYLPQPNNYLDAFQTGIGYNTNIILDGGSDSSSFRLSANSQKGEGIVYMNDYNKSNFDLRANQKLTDKIQIDAGFTFSQFKGQNPPRLGALDGFSSFNFGKLFTWMLPRNYDTKYWSSPERYISALGGAADPNNSMETNKSPASNFWFNLYENLYLQNEKSYRGRMALTMDLMPNLKLLIEGNINNVFTKSETKEKGQGINFSGGSYALGFQDKYNDLLKTVITFNKDLSEKHSINAYFGIEQQNYRAVWENSETDGGLNYYNNFFLENSVNPIKTKGGVRNNKTINSIYTSVDYAFNNQLFLQATWRGDWTSALTYSNGKGNNFYNYPSVSASWIVNETFKNIPDWISFAKLRSNYSMLGSDTDPFKINPGFVFSGINNANGISVPTSTHNSSVSMQPNLKPAIKTAKELGVELKFLQNRIGVDLSIYQDNTKNQILDIQKPFESGITAQTINAGNIQNSGIELRLDFTPIKTQNLNWNSTITYAANRNKIIELFPGITDYNLNADIGEVSTWAVVGKSYGVLRSQINSEKYQAKDAQGNLIDSPKNGLPILSWRDDARTAFPARSNQWQDVGDINSKFRGGWDNTIQYKNWTLNFLIDAKVGGDFVALSYRYGTHTGVFTNTLEGRDKQNNGIVWKSGYDNITYDDGIIPQGVFRENQMITQPDGTQVNVGGMTFQEAYSKGYVEPTHLPQYYYRYGSSSTGVSDYWVVENTWISLRQVALNYNFNKEICQKLKLNNLSLSAVGRDLFYIYNSLPANINPASNNSNNTAFSGEQGFLPMTRTITFALRASF